MRKVASLLTVAVLAALTPPHFAFAQTAVAPAPASPAAEDAPLAPPAELPKPPIVDDPLLAPPPDAPRTIA